jgi:Uma2 family endonuclease
MAGMAPVESRPRKTVEDYLALPEDVRAELLDGELYMTPAPSPEHQDVVGALCVALRTFIESRGLGRVWPAPVDVHLPSGDIVQPDLVFVRAERMAIVQDAIRGVPDLAIEVLSPTRPERDRIVKKQLFAQDGVGEYWIVDPQARALEVFVLEGDRYAPAGWYTGDAAARSPTLPGLAVPLRRVFRD